MCSCLTIVDYSQTLEKMPDHCCVPGCNSNYSKDGTYISVFQFPKDDNRKKIWCKKIPRADFQPSKRSVVCERHFRDDMIVRQDLLPDKNGIIVKIPRKRPVLKDDAYPCIFRGCPSYLSETTPIIRVSREEKLIEKSEATFNSFMEMDKIGDFDTFCKKFMNHVCHLSQDECVFHKTSSNIYIFFMNLSSSPKIEKSIVISESLNLTIYFKDEIVPHSKVQHILSSPALTLWSEFVNVFTYVKCLENSNLKIVSPYEKAIALWQDQLDKDVESSDYTDKHFILDEMKLSLLNKMGKRYSTNLIVLCYSLFIKSAGSYQDLYDKKIIHMPSPRHLKRLTGCLSLKHSNLNDENLQYLSIKCKKLENHEKLVNLLIDEIHVSPNIQYKGKQISGFAENSEASCASSVQAFMISSLKSNYKEMISLVPVKNLTTENLLTLTKQAMELLYNSGFQVFSIISDNNRINRNMFSSLSSNDACKFKISNPTDPSNDIFLLFDSVHLLKSVRNNWLNQLNAEKTFLCPNFDDLSVTEPVSFSLLRKVYSIETDCVIKFAPKLNFTALYPSSIERQNVPLTLRVFDSTNCAALQKYGEAHKFIIPWKPTAEFLSIIKKWWDIMNINHPMKGICQRNANSFVFDSPNDQRLEFLEKFCLWLCTWQNLKQKPRSGCLSAETFYALIHTSQCMIHIIKNLLMNGFSYVLTAKFQTDSLESRFGLYRQMSGSNYHVSVQEIVESERKLRVKSLLYFKSNNYGVFALKTLSSCDGNFEKDFDCDLLQLDDAFTDMECTVSQNEVEILTYIGGYCVHKLHLVCDDCRSKFLKDSNLTIDFDDNIPVPNDCDTSAYLNVLNRGGLKKPSRLVINVLIHCFCVFKRIVSSDYEKIFLKSSSPFNVLTSLMKYYLKNKEVVNNESCKTCKIDLFTNIDKIINIIGNICLKNYCNLLNNKNAFVLNERKVKKFKK